MSIISIDNFNKILKQFMIGYNLLLLHNNKNLYIALTAKTINLFKDFQWLTFDKNNNLNKIK